MPNETKYLSDTFAIILAFLPLLIIVLPLVKK